MESPASPLRKREKLLSFPFFFFFLQVLYEGVGSRFAYRPVLLAASICSVVQWDEEMGVRSARDKQRIVELTDGTNEVNLGPRGLPIHGFDIDIIVVRFRGALMCMGQLHSILCSLQLLKRALECGFYTARCINSVRHATTCESNGGTDPLIDKCAPRQGIWRAP